MSLYHRSVLIIAHPRHELLIHGWLQRERTIVFALTDGSGSHGNSRLHASRNLIEKAGGECGSLFGLMPDRDWYSAILRGDCKVFQDAVSQIVSSLRSLAYSTV
jgi:hypothetical protein